MPDIVRKFLFSFSLSVSSSSASYFSLLSLLFYLGSLILCLFLDLLGLAVDCVGKLRSLHVITTDLRAVP